MRQGSKTVFVCLVVCLEGTIASAQRSLTLPEALARAREQAPQIVSARLAIDEARGRLRGASIGLASNPEIDVGAGRRRGPDARFTDWEVGVQQTFEPPGRRSARIASANASIAAGTANLDEVTRSVLRGAAAAFYRTLHANERLRLLAMAEEFARGIHTAADRRFKAGDIALLDVNIARTARARAHADREAAAAEKVLSLGDLKQLLRLDESVEATGALAPEGSPDLESALRGVADRPEFRSLLAGIDEADAEVRLGESLAKPDFGLGARYSKEEGDKILFGSFSFTLPVFSKGQEQRATGSARALRLRTELEAARQRALIQVKTSFEALERRLAAVRILESEALPGMDENERLTTRSFEAGQIGLADLLVIRREILDTRFQYLDRLLEATLARVELDILSGVLR